MEQNHPISVKQPTPPAGPPSHVFILRKHAPGVPGCYFEVVRFAVNFIFYFHLSNAFKFFNNM